VTTAIRQSDLRANRFARRPIVIREAALGQGRRRESGGRRRRRCEVPLDLDQPFTGWPMSASVAAISFIRVADSSFRKSRIIRPRHDKKANNAQAALRPLYLAAKASPTVNIIAPKVLTVI